MISGEADVIEIKYTISVIHLSHPQTAPSLAHGKIVFHETSPWCHEVEDHRSRLYSCEVWTRMHLLRSLVEYLVSCLFSTQGTCLFQGHMDHLKSIFFSTCSL